MKWTTDKPTEPGWYWCHKHRDIACEMVELVEMPSGDLVTGTMGRLHHHHDYVSEVDWWWCGPIPEPEEE